MKENTNIHAARDAIKSHTNRLNAQAVVLAGTDLFLAFDGRDCGFPAIDCAEIHINTLFSASR